jgi:hypothetical protein
MSNDGCSVNSLEAAPSLVVMQQAVHVSAGRAPSTAVCDVFVIPLHSQQPYVMFFSYPCTAICYVFLIPPHNQQPYVMFLLYP